MKEWPILFSGEMVRAILDGHKTQTRRIIKYQPSGPGIFPPDPLAKDGRWYFRDAYYADEEHEIGIYVRCPYGESGDRLWIKEAHYRYGKWIENGKTKTGQIKWRFVPLVSNESEPPVKIFYPDNPPEQRRLNNKYRRAAWYLRSPLFMPKWAARIWLEITKIRVERIQDISEADVLAEGVKRSVIEANKTWFHKNDAGPLAFGGLWDSINAKRGYPWSSNPWVWVIEFKQIERG